MTRTLYLSLSEKSIDFDPNYLHHDFIEYKDQEWIGLSIYCKKCNVNVLFYNRTPNNNNIESFIEYKVRGNNPLLTCEEYIIKNILE